MKQKISTKAWKYLKKTMIAMATAGLASSCQTIYWGDKAEENLHNKPKVYKQEPYNDKY